jgi:hypothetical protein
MRVAGFGNPALGTFGPTRVFGGDQTDKRHCARGRGEPARIAELRRDREGGEIVDAAETAQALDAWPQGLKVEEGAEILFDVTESSEDFIDGSEIRPVG